MVFLLPSGTGHLLLTWTEAGPSNCGIMSGKCGLAMELPITLLSGERVHYEKNVLVHLYYVYGLCQFLLLLLEVLSPISEVLVSLSISLAPT